MADKLPYARMCANTACSVYNVQSFCTGPLGGARTTPIVVKPSSSIASTVDEERSASLNPASLPCAAQWWNLLCACF